MAWGLGEGLVDEVVTYLSTNLPAKHNALDAAYPDTIVLDDVAAFYRGEKALASIPAFPAVWVVVETTQIEEYRPTSLDAVHELTIGVMVREQDSDTLRRRLYRHVRAIWECLVEGHAAGSTTYHVVGAPFFNFNPIMANGSEYLADASLTIRFYKQETK